LPRVVSPRGMLSTWALAFHKWKKRLAWSLYQSKDLHSASMIHATSEQEAEEVRQLGLRQPLVILANGVKLPASLPKRASLPTGAKTALFLSRIHPKKGVLELISAWSSVRPTNWRLVIAGPDDGGHRASVEALIARERLSADVELVGSVPDSEKWTLYADADLFVLPTFSENFGIVIAEALAAGLPTITTKGAPWRALDEHRCGWWIDMGIDPLVRALKEATSLSDAVRNEMGARGRNYVERELSWDRIAEQMREAYDWLLFGGTAPASVTTD
jgi:glycosyltransferase involved in cell wall biosynthesis